MNAKRKVLKTAKQINDPQIGFYEFNPKTGVVCAYKPHAIEAFEALAKACGWKVVDCTPKKKRKKKK